MTARPRGRRRSVAAVSGERYLAPRRQPLPAGQLQAAVLEHLRAHPDTDLSPAEIANALHRPKSRGAVINACKYWVANGQAIRTHDSPQRYQAAR